MPREIPAWVGRTDDTAIPTKVMLRVLDRQRPAPNALPVCPDCGMPIREGDGCDIDHELALADGGQHAEGNLRAVHRKCHRMKTAREALQRAERRQRAAKAYGLKKPAHPIPGSRASKWKRKLDGTVERRF